MKEYRVTRPTKLRAGKVSGELPPEVRLGYYTVADSPEAARAWAEKRFPGETVEVEEVVDL